MAENQTADEPQPDWERLIKDVNSRITLLRACWNSTAADTPELHQNLVRDLYLPAVRLLGEFCLCVEIENEEADDV